MRVQTKTSGLVSVLILVAIILSTAGAYPARTAASPTYVLHVAVPEWDSTFCSLAFKISYSGDLSGAASPPFDIGPASSPFTVTLTPDSGFTCHPGVQFVFDHWTLDGSNMGPGVSLQVSVDPSHAARSAEANFRALIYLHPGLVSPPNGAIVHYDLVTLRVRVDAMPAESWVPGATVTIYVNGGQTCSGTSDANGYYACDYQLTNLGNAYSWYATASKSAHEPGTSRTWTFTYQQAYQQGASFLHPLTEFWFSRYDMLNAQWDAIHIVNVGTQTGNILITCGAVISDSFKLDAGQVIYRTYSGKACGPVHVSSDQPIWVTQRILGWTAMQEIYGMPGDVASTDIISTWYDLVNAQTDDVYVINPSASQTASVNLYVAGALKGHLDVPAGQELVTNFPGVIGGPLRISSNTPVFASQRVIGYSDFCEVIGLPSWYTFTETWFNWYDMQGASWDAIHVLNPGTSTASVSIYIGGTLKDSFTLSAGAADYRTFPGLIGGPVRVVSTQPIWVTQRIIGWGGWKEVFGVPTTLANTQWYMTWYDAQNAQWDAVHIINPSASDATVQIYVGGVLKSTITVAAGQAAYVTYPGLMTGPVRIVSTVPVICSQRILGWSSFEEAIAIFFTS